MKGRPWNAPVKERPQNWYLRGWVYQDSVGPQGKKQRELVYQGEHYIPRMTDTRFRQLKILFAALTLVLYAVWLVFSLQRSYGGRTLYAGACAMLALIPMIFHAMAIYNLLIASRRMTFRSYYGAFKRLRVTTGLTAGLLAESFLGQVVFMLLNAGAAISWPPEWIWLMGTLISAAAAGAMFFLQRHIVFDVEPGRIDTREQTRKDRDKDE